MADRPSPLLGSLTCVIAACLFAMLGVLSRTTYGLGLTPYAFVTWRSGVAAIAIAALVVVTVRRGARLVVWRSIAPRPGGPDRAGDDGRPFGLGRHRDASRDRRRRAGSAA